MPSKVYSSGSDSKLEATLRNLEMEPLLYRSTHFVNPIWNNLSGKVVIVDLPYDIDLKLLSRRNRLILRFKLLDEDVEYEYDPFPEVKFEMKEHTKPYSDRIINKYMLLDPDYEVSLDDRFLLGTDTIVNDSITLTGYMIIRTMKA
jgi:hypothetical protein